MCIGAGAGGVVPGAGNNVPCEDADGLSFLEDAEHHRAAQSLPQTDGYTVATNDPHHFLSTST